jgi:CRP-like cAMP-binding protein
MTIDEILGTIASLPIMSREKLKENIQEVAFPKGTIILKADYIEKDIFFIKKGIVRGYSSRENGEVTFWFGKEGDTIVSMRSYVENQKGYENIELLEDCELYVLKAEKLQQLFIEDIHIANWGRKFAERELIKTEERLLSLQFRSATERYTELMGKNPNLIQRVQLGHIASYLGITQVSLSRIRADFK